METINKSIQISVLTENNSKPPYFSVHGLSLFIKTAKHNILFDIGPDDTAFKNAELMGIDLRSADIAIISHGHYDHGGSLEKFIALNKTAKIYIQESAFSPHYRKNGNDKKYNGIDMSLKDNERFIKLNGDFVIDDELSLFTFTGKSKHRSTANDTLFDENGLDSFVHEQNLIIHGDKNVLIMGCGHNGVTNILGKASTICDISTCIGGFHLMNPSTGVTVADSLLKDIAEDLKQYKTKFYTCHCTGEKAFSVLRDSGLNVDFVNAGDSFFADLYA